MYKENTDRYSIIKILKKEKRKKKTKRQRKVFKIAKEKQDTLLLKK